MRKFLIKLNRKIHRRKTLIAELNKLFLPSSKDYPTTEEKNYDFIDHVKFGAVTLVRSDQIDLDYLMREDSIFEFKTENFNLRIS